MSLSIPVRENVSLRDFTTFRVGGAARYFCPVVNEEDLAEAVGWANEKNLPLFILGGGSNILVSDSGWDGLVIKIEIRGITSEILADTGGTVRLTVGAGESWDAFVGTCVGRGLYGLENLSGIPGTVGAAPVQNIGAYGAEISQTVVSVRVFDTSIMNFVDFTPEECHFSYRDSIFKHQKDSHGAPRYIIVSVTFNLKKSAPLNISYKDVREFFLKNNMKSPGLADVRQAILAIRAAKLPDLQTVGTAGSFFKNPIIPREHFDKLKEKYPDIPSYPVEGDSSSTSVKVPLAWILDHLCGYRGVRKGNLGTYRNQALVIVNYFSNPSSTTATEIKNFAAEIVAAVKEKTDIDIEPEVQYVG